MDGEVLGVETRHPSSAPAPVGVAVAPRYLGAFQAPAHPLGLPGERVHHRPLDIEIKGVTELVALAVVPPVAAVPEAGEVVLSEAIPAQPPEEVSERLLADLAHPPRREPRPLRAELDESATLQLLHQPLHLAEAP